MKNLNSLFKTLLVVIIMMTPMVFHAKNHDVKNMAKRIDKVYISATPDILENKGNVITVTISAEFPPRYFHKKAVMNITPVLVYENGETELPSMNFIGEKVSGDGVVVDKREGGYYSYTVTIPYNDEMYNSLLIVEPLVYKFKETVYPNHQSIRDKGEFATANTFLIAEGVINTAQNIDKSALKKAYVKPDVEPQVVSDNGSIFFMVNSDAINWSTPLNKNVKNKNAVDELTAHILKGWNVQNIEINGWASPEGPLSYNKDLSGKRAKMTEQFLRKKLASLSAQKNSHVSYKNANDVKFITKGNGADWDGLMKAIENSNIKDKQTILNTLKKQSPEQRVAQLSKYIKQYPEFEKSILPSLRKTIVKVNTIEPKMTDEQITKVCTKNPKSLTCDQMMYAATLVKDLNKKEKIYITAIETYPNHAEPYCNAGAVAIEKGNIKHREPLSPKHRCCYHRAWRGIWRSKENRPPLALLLWAWHHPERSQDGSAALTTFLRAYSHPFQTAGRPPLAPSEWPREARRFLYHRTGTGRHLPEKTGSRPYGFHHRHPADNRYLTTYGAFCLLYLPGTSPCAASARGPIGQGRSPQRCQKYSY